MDDFLFSLEIVGAKVLEDFRHYFPEGYKKTKPMVHWGVEYEIKFMDEEIPEEPGMVSRRFMEITLRADEEPTPAIIAREMIIRGGKSVGAASQKAREKWWKKGQKPERRPEPSIEEEVELIQKTGHTFQDMEEGEGEEGDQDQEEGDQDSVVVVDKPKRQRKPSTAKVKRKSH